jgi:hypothetical protein
MGKLTGSVKKRAGPPKNTKKKVAKKKVTKKT